MILIDARASEHVITMVINTIIPGMIMMLLINDPRYDHDNNPRYHQRASEQHQAKEEDAEEPRICCYGGDCHDDRHDYDDFMMIVTMIRMIVMIL